MLSSTSVLFNDKISPLSRQRQRRKNVLIFDCLFEAVLESGQEVRTYGKEYSPPPASRSADLSGYRVGFDFIEDRFVRYIEKKCVKSPGGTAQMTSRNRGRERKTNLLEHFATSVRYLVTAKKSVSAKQREAFRTQAE